MSNLTTNDQPDHQGPPGVVQEKAVVPDWEKLWAVAGPIVQPIAASLIAAIERSNRHTGIVTGCLLGLIILCLTGLAALSLTTGDVDTAEKIVIALVSFLGGAAIFSGPPKK